jgi:hypothetical protein
MGRMNAPSRFLTRAASGPRGSPYQPAISGRQLAGSQIAKTECALRHDISRHPRRLILLFLLLLAKSAERIWTPTDGEHSRGLRARKIDEPGAKSFFGVILMEDRMSITANVSAGAPKSVNAPLERSRLWTTVLIVGVIVACAIASWFYVDGYLVDASNFGP